MPETVGERVGIDGRPVMRRLFVSRDEPRLRAGWRLVIHALLAALAVLALGVIAVVVSGGRAVGAGTPWELAYASLPVALGLTLATWAARRLVDRRSFASLGLGGGRAAWRDLGAGLFLGAAMVGVVLGVLSALGMLTIVERADDAMPAGQRASNALGVTALFCLVGYYEELLSRGYHLANLADGLGLRWAVFLTSASFALFHLGNPDATPASVVGILAAGLLFAYARVRTGLLWMPIGIHIAWNSALGLLGFPVSGIDVFSLLTLRITGPVWVTGGPFGPEAGVVALPALLLGAMGMHAYTRNFSRQDSV